MNQGGSSPPNPQRENVQARRQDAADVDREHHRIANLPPRIELQKGIDDRAADDLADRTANGLLRAEAIVHPPIIKCSTIGPRANAGTNVNAPTKITTPTSRTTNNGVCVGNVPAVTGVAFFRASEPAIANVGIASQ